MGCSSIKRVARSKLMLLLPLSLGIEHPHVLPLHGHHCHLDRAINLLWFSCPSIPLGHGGLHLVVVTAPLLARHPPQHALAYLEVALWPYFSGLSCPSWYHYLLDHWQPASGVIPNRGLISCYPLISVALCCSVIPIRGLTSCYLLSPFLKLLCFCFFLFLMLRMYWTIFGLHWGSFFLSQDCFSCCVICLMFSIYILLCNPADYMISI